MSEVQERAQWGNKIEFILTVIGFAVGLGAVWRFPYLVFANGGGTFIIIFFFMLFVVGIPLFFLELGVGQFSGLGPTHAFYRMAPLFQGLGYASLSISAFIGFYYNMIIAYCLYYTIMSIRAQLPWSSCDNGWNTAQCNIRNETLNCTQFHELFPNPKSPSEEYFYRKVLNLSDSIGNLGRMEYHLVLSLLACWTTVFIVLSKGIQSLGKVSYFTATFPYVMLTILVITGGLLKGSSKGVEFYIGSADVSKFYSPGAWKDATVQIFYALSTCQGGLIAMSSMNNFRNNIIRDTFLIPILDCLTGLYGGFAIFTVLGYMFVSKCAKQFKDVVAAGPELAFIVYPEGLSLMKAVPPLWSILFFLMMLALGFGSEFSYMETIMIMVNDMFKKSINTKMKVIIMRFTVCLVFFLLGLTMTTQGGFFILSLLNEYTAGYPLLIVGLLEVIVVPWIYGADRLIADIETMIGPKPKWFWMIWKISWKFICPIAILLVIIATAVFGSNELVVNNITFPRWAHGIGYVVSAVPILIIIGCAIAQAIIYKFNWRKLLSPDDAYYENYRRNMGGETTIIETDFGIKMTDPGAKIRPISDEDGKENGAFKEGF